jgi:hypothetical protein
MRIGSEKEVDRETIITIPRAKRESIAGRRT